MRGEGTDMISTYQDNKQEGEDQRAGRSEGKMLQIGQARLHFQETREVSLISRLNINSPRISLSYSPVKYRPGRI